MGSGNTNVCSRCIIGQDCCRNLSGLKLSENEYEQHFAKHSENLEVRQENNLYVVSAIDGKPCPNWIDDQCSIYIDRPMECRLFPYTLGKIIHHGNRINITFHSHTQCPEKKTLLMSKAEANGMILSFARSVFPDADKIISEHEWLFTKLKYKIMRLFTSSPSSLAGSSLSDNFCVLKK